MFKWPQACVLGGSGVHGRDHVPSHLRPSQSRHPGRVASRPSMPHRSRPNVRCPARLPLPRMLTQVGQERPRHQGQLGGHRAVPQACGKRTHAWRSDGPGTSGGFIVSAENRGGVSPSSAASVPVAQTRSQVLGPRRAVPSNAAARGSRNTDLNGREIPQNIQVLRHLRACRGCVVSGGSGCPPWTTCSCPSKVADGGPGLQGDGVGRRGLRRVIRVQ